MRENEIKNHKESIYFLCVLILTNFAGQETNNFLLLYAHN